MNTAEEVDNAGSIGIRFCISLAKEAICQQYTKSRPGIGFQQKQYRFSEFIQLCRTKRRQDSLSDGIVQKQHLRRLDEDRCQR